MQMAFDEVKATQIAAFFLRLAGGRLKYLALIKLLYRLDREALRRWNFPVTTDRYVSMKYGPVTSRIYNLIKDSARQNTHPTFWSTHIERVGLNTVAVKLDPGGTELSPAEEELATEIFKADGAKDGFTLADECHRDFPEWKDPGESSRPIGITDILAALGKSEDDVAHVESSIGLQKALLSLKV
jgi:hypothetical protein